MAAGTALKPSGYIPTSKMHPCWSHLEALESGPRKSEGGMNAEVANVAQSSGFLKQAPYGASLAPEKKDRKP